MKKIIPIIFFLISFTLFSQDTLRVMHYNLLMYGDNFAGCNSTNNNIDDKNEYLNTIVEYVQPDILTVNEIYKTSYYHEYLKDYALNINGTDYYEMGNIPNLSNGYTVNQIYYNSEKLTMVSNNPVETNIRDIDIFKLSIDNNGTETIYLNCVVAHLKAGQGYESERANETNKLMTYLDTSNASGNYLMSGDFNVYTFSEEAFQNLVYHPNNNIRFYDPINTMGSWNNNSYYASVHTQSTHTSGECPSGGGMDDRFDFILAADEIINGTDKITYLPGSYKALGQDGQHFNKSLISSPTNTTVPYEVLNALYNMSDHLPVIMDLVIDENMGINDTGNQNIKISFQNPVKENIELMISADRLYNLVIGIQNIQGKTIYYNKIKMLENKTSFNIPINNFKSGFYLLKMEDGISINIVKKIIIL
ncbi:MAG: hypothetical protein B6D61_06510 [Bacteroidetes bacterium 4484_249]|nr:MAG: hypothetical protein B6D61_06510 [Bacteroidetes bacterium 4484_249]